MLTIVVYFQTLNNIQFCIWKAKLLINRAFWYFIPILYSCPHRLLSDGNEYCWTAGGTPLSMFMSHLCSIKTPLFSSLGNGCCECFCCFFSSSGVSRCTSDSSRTGVLPGTISQQPHAFYVWKSWCCFPRTLLSVWWLCRWRSDTEAVPKNFSPSPDLAKNGPVRPGNGAPLCLKFRIWKCILARQFGCMKTWKAGSLLHYTTLLPVHTNKLQMAIL